MPIFFSLGAFLLLSASVLSSSYTLTHPIYNPGFFSVFNTVLGALDFCEENPDCTDLTVDFEKGGLFYDSEHGPNWWSYYFEPIYSKSEKEAKTFPTYKKITFSLSSQFEMSKDRGFALLQRYVKVKPHIQEKLDTFTKKHFQNYKVVGLHYRGTDKKSEAPEISYEEVAEKIRVDLLEKNTKVFIATDDELFLIFMREKFQDKVIAIEALRSTDGTPVHLDITKNPYQKGEDALLDCILLSKCSKLYKMASNLSDTSLKFNPDLEVIHLNRSYSVVPAKKKQNVVKAINTALHLLNEQEKNGSDFGMTFPVEKQNYQDQEGNNWWNFHFLPLPSQEASFLFEVLPFIVTKMGLDNLFEMPKEKAHELIEKYIRLKPKTTETIENIWKNVFQDHYVIAVNHVQQSCFCNVSDEEIFKKVQQLLEQKGSENCKLFLMTQDPLFLKKMQSLFRNVFCIDPPHQNNLSDFETEELELIQCLLLSRSDVVIGASSELLKLASQFNPSLPIITFDTLWLEK